MYFYHYKGWRMIQIKADGIDFSQSLHIYTAVLNENTYKKYQNKVSEIH